MKVFVTGDIHGAKDIHKLNSKNFIEASFLTKDDFLIITGDFGLLWSNKPDREEIWWLNWLNLNTTSLNRKIRCYSWCN